MTKNSERKSGFLTRLRRDQRGNFIMISAAAIIPLMGVVGAVVDLSRAYISKSRLQNACDAGALAGRRSVVGGQFTDANKATARAFFDNNFPEGVYGSQGLSVTYNANSSLVVTGLASATVPTSIMKLFGKETIEIAVSCDAEMQVPNSDIMFVLDTTGSMADTNAGDTVSKIAALRTAVTGFYTSLEAAKTPASQVRYGFVPYATTVNVGGLLQRDWMVDKWTYQSREQADKTTKTTTATSAGYWTYGGFTKTGGTSTATVSYLPQEDCVAPANTSTTTNTYSTSVVTNNDDGTQTTVRTLTQVINGSSYSVSISGSQCKLTKTTYSNYTQNRTETYLKYATPKTTTTTSDVYNWYYRPVEYDVSGLKGTNADGTMKVNTTLSAMISGGGSGTWTARTITWKGCIEERDTERSTDYTNTSLNFYDLNIDLIPTKGDAKTQWRPALGTLVYARKSITNWQYAQDYTSSGYTNIGDYMSGFYASCPSAARKLGTITSAQLTTYLNGLAVSGNTYHDIGFLWGLRLLSPTGLFAAENGSAANGGSIQRHLIFMTDGNTDTDILNYEAYGLSALDRRRTANPTTTLPTNTGQNTIVEGRLQYLCTQAKNRNVTVWVIAFGTDLTSLLSSCASSGRAFQANNATELNNTFAKIATQISQLRLTR